MPLVSYEKKRELAAGPVYRTASPALRSRLDRVAAYHLVDIPVRVTGTLAVPEHDGGGSIAAIDLNQSYYEPALYAAADYLITSSSIRGRYQADPVRFARQSSFYGLLDRWADPIAAFTPTGPVSAERVALRLRAHRSGPSHSRAPRRPRAPRRSRAP